MTGKKSGTRTRTKPAPTAPTSRSKLSPAAVRFEAAGDAIQEGYRQRKKLPRLPPFDGKWGFLKREAYRLIRRQITEPGGHRTIKSIVRRWKREPREPSYDDNPFYWGLLAIDPAQDILDQRDLTRFAHQLMYAHRHDVPAHFLVGFLYQSGSTAEVSRKLAEGQREPWFGALRNTTAPR